MAAQWIWLPSDTYPQLQTSYYNIDVPDKANYPYGVAEFRCTVELPQPPVRVQLRISGDPMFRLWLNDRFIGHGPASVGSDFRVADPLPWYFVNPYTIENPGATLSFFAQVQRLPQVLTETSQGPCGFYLEGTAEFVDGTTMDFGTDEGWLCRLNPQYVDFCRYDGTIEPDPWQAAKATGDQRELTVPDIAMLAFENVLPEDPQQHALTLRTGDHLWVPFNKIYGGYVSLISTGDCQLRVDSCELPDQKVTTELVTLKANQPFRSLRMHSIGGYHIHVLSAQEGAVLRPWLAFSHYPTPILGTLKTSDPALNLVHDVCTWTLKLCRQSLHLDSTLHQELLACTGDYYIESLMTLFTYGDMRLAALDVRRTAWLLEHRQGKMFHTTYSLIWVQMLARMYQITGDKALLSDCQPALKILLERFHGYLGDTGVLEEAPDFMFVDWTVLEGYSMHHPPKALGQAVLCAFYYKALTTAVELCQEAELLGLNGWMEDAAVWQSRAETFKEAFHRCFWDEERGLYIDGLPTPWGDGTHKRPINPPIRHFSRYPQILAALYDLCPPEQARRLTDIAVSDNDLPDIQPYFMHFGLEAVIHTGLWEKHGMRILDRWKPVVADCDKGLQEGWIKPEEGYSFDHSHAWGGTPAYHLPLMLTGLEILEPGMRKIALAPKLWGLKWAEITFPTPCGMLSIRMQEGQEPEIDIPDGLEVVIRS